MRAIAAILGCLIAVAPAIAQGAKLAVGPAAGGYLCPDGREFYIARCESDGPSANCGTVLMHLPRNGKRQVEGLETRSALAVSLEGCKVYPVTFRDGIVSLSIPTSVARAPPQSPPQPKPATPQTSTVPGTIPPVALVRIQTTSVFANYFDESAVFPASQQGIVAARGLTFFPGGDPDNRESGGRWVEYIFDCGTKDYDVTAVTVLDLQAKPVGAPVLNIQNKAPYARLAEAISFDACKKTSAPISPELRSPRFKTTAEAFADAKAAVAYEASPAGQAARAAQAQASRWLFECYNDKGASCTAAGRAYRTGFATEAKDLTKAATYLGEGCRLNDGEGCFTLSTMYRDGEGVKKDLARAKQLFDKACTLKSPSCLAAQKASATP